MAPQPIRRHALAAATSTPLPRQARTWGHLTVVGALLNAVPFTLFAYGQQYISGSGHPPVALATGQLLCATGMMLPVLAVSGTTADGPVTSAVVASMLVLGALGSGLAYVLNFHIVAAAGASTASTVTYVTPVVAAAVGVTLLGEQIAWNEPVGGLIVLAGIAVAQGRLRLPSRQATGRPASR